MSHKPPPRDAKLRGLRGRRLWLALLDHQQRWIEWCESNERSYTGPRGELIRAADYAELRRLERLARP